MISEMDGIDQNRKGGIIVEQYIYGVDLGGTTVKMGLFDKEGTLLEKWEIVTR